MFNSLFGPIRLTLGTTALLCACAFGAAPATSTPAGTAPAQPALAVELGVRTAMPFDHLPGAIGDGTLEHRLRGTHSRNWPRRGGIHVRLLRVKR